MAPKRKAKLRIRRHLVDNILRLLLFFCVACVPWLSSWQVSENATWNAFQLRELALSSPRVDPETTGPLDTRQCRCVNCNSNEDIECGGLWTGDTFRGDPNSFQKISIVISHCLNSLNWLEEFTQGFSIHDITIVSKCDQEVQGAPMGSSIKRLTIERLPNVGRCDHTYAHWISKRVKEAESPNDDKEVVVFLKDDRSKESIHQAGQWRSLSEMLRTASHAGFSCGQTPTLMYTGKVRRFLSAYHEMSVLANFTMQQYSSKNRKYADLIADEESFASSYKDLGDWADSIGLELPKELVNVCYGGTFAATIAQLRKQKESVWSALEHSLARANNIEEGHFAERTWGGLLSTDLPQYQVEALRAYQDKVLTQGDSVMGGLSIRLQRRNKIIRERKNQT